MKDRLRSIYRPDFWLFSMPGHSPTAVMMKPAGTLPRGVSSMDVLFERLRLTKRLLGPRVEFDEVLSDRWKADVICTPEFSRWWRMQPQPPAPEHRIFLRFLKA